jgi:hypothetical protein
MIERSERHRTAGIATAALFAVGMFGYPVVGVVTSVLSLDSRLLSVPFRATVALFSLVLIATKKPLRLDGFRVLILILWILYICRLLWDAFVGNILSTNTPIGADFALQFFVGACALPALAVYKQDAYDARLFSVASFFAASVGALGSLASLILGAGETAEQTLEAGGRLTLAALNPGTIGAATSNALLCALVLWRGSGTSSKFVFAVSVPALWICLLLSGTKGALLGLGACLVLWLIRNEKTLYLAPVFALGVAGVYLLGDNALTTRLSSAVDDDSTGDRILLIVDSLLQIGNGPWFGTAFVELKTGFYPHNIFLEAALALGVPMAAVFATLLIIGCWRAWRSLNGPYALIGLLYLQSLLLAAVGGSIWGMNTVWLTLLLLPASTGDPNKWRFRRFIVREP